MLKARTRKTAISARVTVSLGQKIVERRTHPVVTPRTLRRSTKGLYHLVTSLKVSSVPVGAAVRRSRALTSHTASFQRGSALSGQNFKGFMLQSVRSNMCQPARALMASSWALAAMSSLSL